MYKRQIERYQDHLNIFASWLQLHNLESAPAHVAEAATLTAATEALVNRVIEKIHDHDPLIVAGAPAPHAQGHPTAAKPVMALKPDRLSFDANLGTVQRWKQRFRAFHASTNLRVLPLPDKQAFLIACIDDEVANRINRLVTETTPIFPNNAAIPCSITIIVKT